MTTTRTTDTAPTCTHPMGFGYSPAIDGLACFDCKAECPGRCVCGAPYRSMVCLNRGHLNGPRLASDI